MASMASDMVKELGGRHVADAVGCADDHRSGRDGRVVGRFDDGDDIGIAERKEKAVPLAAKGLDNGPIRHFAILWLRDQRFDPFF